MPNTTFSIICVSTVICTGKYIVGIHLLHIAPFRVEKVGDIIDIDADLYVMLLSGRGEVEVLHELEIQTVVPRHRLSATFRERTFAGLEVLVALYEIPEGCLVLVGCEYHLFELGCGRDVEQGLCAAVVGDGI